MADRVSFIIPYYNSGNTVQETVDSIFKQSYDNFDIWIINDGSTDELSLKVLDKLRKDSTITVLDQMNQGPSIARNNALSRVTSKYFFPLDADNKICADTISICLDKMTESSSIAAVYGDYSYLGKQTGFKKNQPFDIQKMLIYNQVDTCALVRKQVFDDGLVYDPFLSKLGLEDWEFWINVYKAGWEIKYINEVLFEMRVSLDSRTFQVANKNIDKIKHYVYTKHADLLAKEYENLFYEKKMLSETPDYKIGNLLLKPYRILKQTISR
ncbi:MAG: glycosyltransferase family 2 protein [Bacteroidetes bacterium]|nr:glycosyltransferase family 2 protein [Bacteroidota bacterium]